MYEAFFGFREQPFSNTPDPRFFLPTRMHEEALESLLQGIARRRGFLVLTGDVGTGKTTLCRALLGRLGNDADVALVLNPDLSETEIITAIVRDFGLPAEGASRAAMMDALYLHLVARARAGRTALIVVDDAQNLPLRSLEQVRMISNFETDTEKLVQILLVGQPELEERLASPEFRQVAQRVADHPRLEPLGAEGTRAYVAHRLACAARPPAGAVFTERAIARIHRATRGYPRSINTLCDRALLAACRERRRVIDVDIVREVCRGFRAPSPARRPNVRRRVLAGLGAAAAVAAALAVALVPRDEQPPAPRQAQAAGAARLAALEQSIARLEQRVGGADASASLVASLEEQGAALERELVAARGDSEQLRALLRRREGELQALQRRLAPSRDPGTTGDAAAPAAASRAGELGEREAELRRALDSLEGERRSSADRVRRLEEALEALRGRLVEAERQRRELGQALEQKDRLLAGQGAGATAAADLERLQTENDQLRQTQELLERISSQTIEAQGREIERLTQEKEDLLRLGGETGAIAPAPRPLTAAAR